MADERTDGRWVTLDNGVHLFIKKGQTLDDAIEKLENNPEKPKIRTEKNDPEIRRINKPIDKENKEKAKLYDLDRKNKFDVAGTLINDAETRKQFAEMFGIDEKTILDRANKLQEEKEKKENKTVKEKSKLKEIANKKGMWESEETETFITEASQNKKVREKALQLLKKEYEEKLNEKGIDQKLKNMYQEDLQDIEHVITNGDTKAFWKLDTVVRDDAIDYLKEAVTGKNPKEEERQEYEKRLLKENKAKKVYTPEEQNQATLEELTKGSNLTESQKKFILSELKKDPKFLNKKGSSILDAIQYNFGKWTTSDTGYITLGGTRETATRALRDLKRKGAPYGLFQDAEIVYNNYDKAWEIYHGW